MIDDKNKTYVLLKSKEEKKKKKDKFNFNKNIYRSLNKISFYYLYVKI